MERMELMTLVNIIDLTHLVDWEDLPLIWKHKYYLPAEGNLVVVYNLTYGTVSVSFNRVKRVDTEVS